MNTVLEIKMPRMKGNTLDIYTNPKKLSIDYTFHRICIDGHYIEIEFIEYAKLNGKNIIEEGKFI